MEWIRIWNIAMALTISMRLFQMFRQMFMLVNKGGGDQKSPKSCLRNLCTAPNVLIRSYIVVSILKYRNDNNDCIMLRIYILSYRLCQRYQ